VEAGKSPAGQPQFVQVVGKPGREVDTRCRGRDDLRVGVGRQDVRGSLAGLVVDARAGAFGSPRLYAA